METLQRCGIGSNSKLFQVQMTTGHTLNILLRSERRKKLLKDVTSSNVMLVKFVARETIINPHNQQRKTLNVTIEATMSELSSRRTTPPLHLLLSSPSPSSAAPLAPVSPTSWPPS
ncbi:unnamed protein product [Ectocarpus sp. 4 AP-2014]